MIGLGVAIALVAFTFYLQELARVWRDQPRKPARLELIVAASVGIGLGVWLSTLQP